MLATRARNLLDRLRKHWHAWVFLLALLSLSLLHRRMQVEERRAEEGKDALAVAYAEFAQGRPAAAARSAISFLERFPGHSDRGPAFFLLARCRLRLARGDEKPDRLVLVLDALASAQAEGYPAADVREMRLEVARLLEDRGALREALAEFEALCAEDPSLPLSGDDDASLHLKIARIAEELIDEVDPARVAAAAVAGLVPPGPAATLDRLSALERAMRSPMLEKALSALQAHAKQGEEAHLEALARRGRLYLRRRFYWEAVDALAALLAEVERKLPGTPRDPLYPDRPRPGAPWPRRLSVVAREAYEARGRVRLERMRTWSDPERAHRDFLLAVNDLGRAEELARRDQDGAAAERAGYLVARAYQLRGDIPGAISRYQRLLSRSPSPVAEYASLARLGQMFLARGDEAKGLEFLSRAVAAVPQGTLSTTRFPDLPVPSLLLGAFPGDRGRDPARREADVERLDVVARVAEAWVSHFPSDAALLDVVGGVRRRLGELLAIAAATSARRGQPAREVDRLREEARAHYERAGKAFADGSEAATGERAVRMRHAAGVAFARAGDPFRAVEQLQAYLDVCPRDDAGQPEAVYELARAAVALGDFDRALRLFDRLKMEFPNNALYTFPARFDVAEVRRAQGDLEGAVRELKGILSESDRIQPSSEVWKKAKFEIGHVWYELARRRRAEKEVEPARQAFREARRELEQALTYFPEEARLGILALDTLAQIAVDEEDWTRAFDSLTRLLALGDVADEEGNAAKLEEPYATACGMALVRRADCEFRLGRLADAARSYEEARKQISRKAAAIDCLYRLAVCQKRLGQDAEAARTLETARVALDRLAAAGEIDEDRRGRWRMIFDRGTAGLLTWQGF